MATGIVQEMKFNVAKQSKAGKAYTVTQMKYVSDKGQAKTENVFDSASYADIVKGLAPGDEIDVKYEKNGEFFNVVDVKLLKKGNGVFPSPVTKAAGTGGKTYHEDPERQASIIRQSSLKAGVDLVGHMLNKELYKKATPDMVVGEVLRITKKFELYAAGKEQQEALAKAIEGADIPFEEQHEIYEGDIPE